MSLRPQTLPLTLPAWNAPATVGAAMSTREGGCSPAPWDSLNLRPAELDAGPTPVAGDSQAAVAENQQRWAQAIDAQPRYLCQVHGTTVVSLEAPQSLTGAPLPVADASVSTTPGLACTVLVADCLPVLFCDRQGRGVAAAHAGWRGLAAGVLDRTVEALRLATGAPAADLLAWLGPCIGPESFEVGPDVLTAFEVDPAAQTDPVAAHPRFRWAPRPDGQARWRANLAGLAEDRLRRLGLQAITLDGRCTVKDPLRFFSFRRDGRTGRMAASIWLKG